MKGIKPTQGTAGLTQQGHHCHILTHPGRPLTSSSCIAPLHHQSEAVGPALGWSSEPVRQEHRRVHNIPIYGMYSVQVEKQ